MTCWDSKIMCNSYMNTVYQSTAVFIKHSAFRTHLRYRIHILSGDRERQIHFYRYNTNRHLQEFKVVVKIFKHEYSKHKLCNVTVQEHQIKTSKNKSIYALFSLNVTIIKPSYSLTCYISQNQSNCLLVHKQCDQYQGERQTVTSTL